MLLSQFTRSFLASHPSHRIVTRDVQSIPHLDYDALEAGRTDPKLHSPEQKRAFALADELTDELVNADAIIISTPMYNWSLPSALKAWIDRVVNCRTFYLRTDTVAKIPVTLLLCQVFCEMKPRQNPVLVTAYTNVTRMRLPWLTVVRRPLSLSSQNDARRPHQVEQRTRAQSPSLLSA